MKKHLGLCSLALLLITTACTKELPYESLRKDKVQSKALVDTSSKYLYVPSTLGTSSDSVDAMPYFQGGEKLVTMKFTENALQISEIPADPKFEGNPSNHKLVIEIPVDHLSYRCQKDRFGECVNKEEENNDIDWKDKEFFKPKMDQVKIVETSVLPLELEEIFGSQKCYSETGTRLESYQWIDSALNIILERTYKVKPECWSTGESLSESVISVYYQYSFAKLDSIISPNYSPLAYSEEDEDTFGFFATKGHRLDVDNRQYKSGEFTLMNRWNPARTEIKYYLDKNYLKPENKALRAAAETAVENVNKGLKIAGINFKLVTEAAPEGMTAGDIRNSMLVLIEEPTQTSLLGYGPSVANPLTGEVVSSRVVMYSGNLTSGIRSTYEDLRLAVEKNQSVLTKLSLSSVGANKVDSTKAIEALKALSGGAASTSLPVLKAAFDTVAKKETKQGTQRLDVEKAVKKFSQQASGNLDLKDRLTALSKHCQFPGEMVNYRNALLKSLEAAGLDTKALPAWTDLSSSTRKKIIDAVVPMVFVPVLVHEIGHNLGLRHNFHGSIDKANFYSKAELQNLGIDDEIKYSSVMDYTSDELKSLPVLGKYDVAALRFGYRQELEVVKNSNEELVLPLNEARGLKEVKIKSYEYCSDESVGASLTCRRFDDGTTLTEITLNAIESYGDAYRLRNFRNGARRFGAGNEDLYLNRLNNLIADFRLTLEQYEFISTNFKIPAEQWQQDSFLSDLYRSTLLSGLALMEIVVTPELTCLVQSTGGTGLPSRPEAVPLAAVSPMAVDCNSVSWNEGFKTVGSFGKSFQSIRGSTKYADEYDVRGIWIDKLAALDALFSRDSRNPMFNRRRFSFVDVPGMNQALFPMIRGVVFNDLASAEMDASWVDGTKSSLGEVRYKFSEAHRINQPFNGYLAARFEIPKEGQDFKTRLINVITKNAKDPDNRSLSEAWLKNFTVYRGTADLAGEKPEATVTVGNKVFAATKSQVIALNAMTALAQARMLAAIIADFDEEKKPQERLVEILTAIVKAASEEKSVEVPADASKAEKAAYAIDAQTAQMALDGSLESAKFYEDVLWALPSENKVQ